MVSKVSFSADFVYGASDGSLVRPAGDTILAFTSDVHNCPGDASAKRLGSWIDMIRGKYGRVESIGLCGDMANSGVESADEYWKLTKVVINTVLNKGIEGIYITGNHEYDPGDA